MKVVFVGGGKAAVLMLEEFHKDQHIDVIGLADPNQDAEGVRRARELGIRTVKDLKDVVSLPGAEQLRGLIRQMNGAVRAGNDAAKGIEQVMREIRLLALNGNVEAARAGEAGRAFAVVVQRMQVLVGEVAKAVDAMGTSSRESHEVLRLMERTEDLLRDNAHVEMMSNSA